MTMEMIEVEAFVAIARAGSFTRAAEGLYLSQPAISRRMELLERELGAPLFERTRGGARLTEAGRAFLPFAQQILAAARDGAEAVRAVEQEEQGEVVLALVGTLASTALTAQLRRFRAAHPLIRVMIRTGRSEEVGAMVRRGEAGLGLRYFADPDPEVVSELVAEEALIVVCAADSRLVPARPREPAELAGVPWVAFPPGRQSPVEPYARLPASTLQRAGLGDVETVAIDSLTAQKRLIEADFGLGMLPESGVEEELRLGTLRRLDVPALRASIPVALIHRRRGYLSRAARRLRAELGGG